MMRVVKIGGRAQSDPRLARALAEAAGAAPAVSAGRARGALLCIVHGGGDEVSALQRRMGLEPVFVGGRRVTSADDLQVVRMVLSGTINKRIVTSVREHGVSAVGISGEDGGLFMARAIDLRTMGRVGGDVAVNPALILHLLDGGFVPVVSPLASDGDAANGAGLGLNVNGDDAAAALAVALHADELVMVADVPGVIDDGLTLPTLNTERASVLVAGGTAGGGMAAKLQAAALALHGGVAIVRIGGLDAISDANAGTTIMLSHSSV